MKRKKTKASDLPEFDPAEYLDSDEAVAEYLTAVLAENDPALLAAALGDIARARGMSDIAKSTGLAREALYKALRPGAQPRFDTVSRVCAALGVRLVAEPYPESTLIVELSHGKHTRATAGTFRLRAVAIKCGRSRMGQGGRDRVITHRGTDSPVIQRTRSLPIRS